MSTRCLPAETPGAQGLAGFPRGPPSTLPSTHFFAPILEAPAIAAKIFEISENVWGYDKDTKIFYVNDAYDTITESSAESIATDILDVVYFTVDSETKVLDTVFIVDKTATNPGTPSTPGTIAGTSSTSSNSDAALKAEAQGAYTFEAGTAFNGISDIAGGIENNIFFKFDTTAANQNVVLKINQSNGTNVYTEGAAPATAGGHYFYVQVTGSALNNAGSGSLKNTALTSGNYTWSITSSGATLVSGTFSIA